MQGWDDLRIFLAVARAGSVSAAAELLGVNQSTVSRRVNRFELELEVRLFERLSTGYQLTEQGQELLQRALRIEDEASSVERDIAGRNVELKGPIRLTTSLVMVNTLLMPILKTFNLQYPGIEIQLDLSDNLFNLNQREADVALRVTTKAPPDNLIGRELGQLELGVYGENNYLKKYLSGKKPPALRWIGEDNKASRPNWLHADGKPLELVMRSNDVLATYQAIRLGMGVGRLPALLGDATVELMRLEDTPKLAKPSLWLLTHVDMRRLARMKAFNTFLADSIRRELEKNDSKQDGE